MTKLRNLIFGTQGSYVVLAFRRMMGTELYYFAVELMRGTPEYFESLKNPMGYFATGYAMPGYPIVGDCLVGIGLIMQQDLDLDASGGVGQNKVWIKSVVPGGACDRGGLIQVGDTVWSINGENAVGLTMADISERIFGPIGSQISITLESGATGEIFERVLVRGHAQAPSVWNGCRY